MPSVNNRITNEREGSMEMRPVGPNRQAAVLLHVREVPLSSLTSNSFRFVIEYALSLARLSQHLPAGGDSTKLNKTSLTGGKTDWLDL
jgi:hypothetical protein